MLCRRVYEGDIFGGCVSQTSSALEAIERLTCEHSISVDRFRRNAFRLPACAQIGVAEFMMIGAQTLLYVGDHEVVGIFCSELPILNP